MSTDLSSTVLQYLDAKSLSCLDVSISEKVMRPVFLSCMKFVALREANGNIVCNNFVHWVRAREISLKHAQAHRSLKNSSLEQLANSCPELMSLELSHLPSQFISDETIIHVVSMCRKLEKLHLTGQNKALITLIFITLFFSSTSNRLTRSKYNRCISH